jgi:hypothetical protein
MECIWLTELYANTFRKTSSGRRRSKWARVMCFFSKHAVSMESKWNSLRICSVKAFGILGDKPSVLVPELA